MILPDSRCEIHGETLVLWHHNNRGRQQIRAVCRSCRREEVRARNGGLTRRSPLDNRCGKGHLKTPFSYGMYGGKLKCILCARERGRKKKR